MIAVVTEARHRPTDSDSKSFHSEVIGDISVDVLIPFLS